MVQKAFKEIAKMGFILMVALMADFKEEAWNFIKSKDIGVLSTSYDGVPFGSLLPFALDDKNNPIIYISDLAIHTDNIKKSAKCSLTVSKVNKKDIFNSSRATIIVEAVKVTDKKVEELYFKKFPKAKRFGELHDFSFYRLEVKKVYYVGGFGNIGWVD